MAALGTVQVAGFKVAYWKYTYRITLPNGRTIWSDSYQELTEVLVRVIISKWMIAFDAGKKEQCNLIKNVLQIK